MADAIRTILLLKVEDLLNKRLQGRKAMSTEAALPEDDLVGLNMLDSMNVQ